MISLAKVKSFVIEEGKRIVKVLQHGVKTAKEVSPFGIDSGPLEDMTAIYLETENRNEAVIVGYINKNRVAEAGEIRLYSTGPLYQEKSYIYLKKDGKININGDAFSAVRFEPLKSSFSSLDLSVNTELGKISASIAALSGTYLPGVINTSIDNSKSEDILIK